MDYYDELPAKEVELKKTGQNSSMPTSASIRAELSGKLYVELTNEDDAVTENCIQRSLVRAESLLHLLHKKLSLENPVQRRSVILLTVYELYAYNGDEKGGREYLQTATELLSNTYGNVENAKNQGRPSGALCKPKRRRLP